MKGTNLWLPPTIALVAAVSLGGCAQITVTADTVVDGTARVADATTNAVEGTSDFTTNTTNRADAQTHSARLAYLQSQMAMLRREAAAGDGEHLEALAYMMQADSEKRFANVVQAHYGELFENGNNAEQVLSQLYDVAGTPPAMQAG